MRLAAKAASRTAIDASAAARLLPTLLRLAEGQQAAA